MSEGMGRGHPLPPPHVASIKGDTGLILNYSHSHMECKLKNRPPRSVKSILKSENEVKPRLTLTHSARGEKKGQMDALPTSNWL